MKHTVLVQLSRLALAIQVVAASAAGQTDPIPSNFANFETPQTHPIELVQLGGTDYIAVCNTPDNSVEFYATSAGFAFLGKVRVGLGPSSVRWNPDNERIYVTNFDGDSVSMIDVRKVGAALVVRLLKTTSEGIGDEPSDIAFGVQSGIPVAMVTLSGESSARFLNVQTLQPLAPPLQQILPLVVTSAAPFRVVHSPRYIEWLPGNGHRFIANLRGGSPDSFDSIALSENYNYDVGIFRVDALFLDLDPDVLIGSRLTEVGSTNHAFAITSTEDRMFVVGTRAQNHAAGPGGAQVQGEAAIAALETGFVQSSLTVVELDPISGAMLRVEEAEAGTTPSLSTPMSINLNRDYGVSALTAVPTGESISQPTGVELIEGTAGDVTHIAVTGFHSDRVAILKPALVPGGYTFEYVDLVPLAPPVAPPGSEYSVVGPRGVVYSPQADRFFVNGALDNSLTVIDPDSTGATLLRRPLQHDPTPVHIQKGREFLYSARFSIGTVQPAGTPKGGFVSCASCHVDARTDGLAWNLGSTEPDPSDPLKPELVDPVGVYPGSVGGVFPTTQPIGMGFPENDEFPTDKGPIVTQTMQGLVNYELNLDYQHVATNAPYYWRGARGTFGDFNKAFVNLQGMDPLPLVDTAGISTEDMEVFEVFINTIRHPPNPEQDFERVTTGSLGDPNDPDDGSGALKGMEQFHNTPVLGGSRSCVDCHSLPEGSSNTMTLGLQIETTLTGGQPQIVHHPLETAALRNIATRERVKHFDFEPATVVTFVKSLEGLFHSGHPEALDFAGLSSWSINNFVHSNDAFDALNDPLEFPAGTDSEAEVTEFVRQFDTGTAPAVGYSITYDPSAVVPPDVPDVDDLEMQARNGNIGLAVIVSSSSSVNGYWFDLTKTNQVGYRHIVNGTLVDRQTLLDMAVGWPAANSNTVVFQATALGDERRIAHQGGETPILSGGSPANVVLLPMVPNTAYVDVAEFDSFGNSGALHYDPAPATGPNVLADPATSIWTQRTLQHAVHSLTTGVDFGVTSVHHEPPRRFRVAGTRIRAGAKLRLYQAISVDGSGPTASEPTLEMNLYPVDLVTSSGLRVWETNVELDATQTFALLCGGYKAPGVQDVLDRGFQPLSNQAALAAAALVPSVWNWYRVQVINEDGTEIPGTLPWQRLTVQDDRAAPLP